MSSPEQKRAIIAHFCKICAKVRHLIQTTKFAIHNFPLSLHFPIFFVLLHSDSGQKTKLKRQGKSGKRKVEGEKLQITCIRFVRNNYLCKRIEKITDMPRKTDGILFELQPRPTKGEDGKPLLYAQPVIDRKFDLDDIDNFCAKYRHTSKGEMQRLFFLLEEVTTMWLRQGYRVETPFGSFAPKLKLLGEHTDPNKVLGRDVAYNGIEYIPSKQFVKDADCSRDGFRRLQGSVGNRQMYDPKAMDEALRRSTRNGYVTISTFMIYSHLKRKSAKAYLDSLCEGDNPHLRRYREGRTLHYTILHQNSTE